MNTTTRLILLIHHREHRKPTNTGMLAVASLSNSEFHIIGQKDQPLDYASIIREDAENLVLFPSADATLLTKELCQSFTKPIHFLVPDGNWGQASRIRHRLCENPSVRKVTLPDLGPGIYSLRKESPERPEGLSTCEAIARAYTIMEGAEVGAKILDVFRKFCEGRLPRTVIKR